MTVNSVGPFLAAVEVPDGAYDGTQSAYLVRMTVGGQEVRFETDVGVRGLDCPVRVTVAGGKATVESR